jgi:uncharacterized delta-60 repeat protein
VNSKPTLLLVLALGLAVQNDLGAFAPKPNATVRAAVVQADHKLVVAGDFTQVDGAKHAHLARLNPNGEMDADFNPSTDSPVDWLVLQSDGKLVLGGYFENVNGSPRKYIARLNADGTLDPDFQPTLEGGGVRSIAVQPDGKIVLGGFFYESQF